MRSGQIPPVRLPESPCEKDMREPLSEEELAYFTLQHPENARIVWPVKVADGAESESSTSQASHGQERADSMTRLEEALTRCMKAAERLIQAVEQNSDSNRQLLMAMLDQAQEEGEMPSTQYLNGKPLR